MTTRGVCSTCGKKSAYVFFRTDPRLECCEECFDSNRWVGVGIIGHPGQNKNGGSNGSDTGRVGLRVPIER